MKKLRNGLDRMMVSGQVAVCATREKLKEKKGISDLVVVVLICIIAIVAVVVIFWPWVQSLLKNLFTNADSKIDSVWNYNG